MITPNISKKHSFVFVKNWMTDSFNELIKVISKDIKTDKLIMKDNTSINNTKIKVKSSTKKSSPFV